MATISPKWTAPKTQAEFEAMIDSLTLEDVDNLILWAKQKLPENIDKYTCIAALSKLRGLLESGNRELDTYRKAAITAKQAARASRQRGVDGSAPTNLGKSAPPTIEPPPPPPAQSPQGVAQ
jgi:hypothetical protein